MITKLNTLLDDIKTFRICNDLKIYQRICDIIVNRDDLRYIIDDNIIQEEMINDIISNKDWVEIKIILSQIEYINQDIYYIDAYGHIRNITNNDWELIIEELINNI